MPLERANYPVGDNWKELGQAVQITEMPNPTTFWYGFESVTVSSTVVGLSQGLRSNGDVAFITVESNQIRYRIDSGVPTATVGHVLNAGDILELDTKDELMEIRFIRTGGADATIRVSYGRKVAK